VANDLKGLDAPQVLRSVYDDTKNTLRVSIIDGSTGGGGGFEVIISHTDDSIRLGDGTNYFTSTSLSGKVALDVNTVNNVQLFDMKFDTITATYPLATQEVYQSRVGGISGAVQQTITINYTDATKNLILNVVRT
jgi:hypothetical protein